MPISPKQRANLQSLLQALQPRPPAQIQPVVQPRIVETDPLFKSSPAARLTYSDLDALRTKPKQGERGPKGDKGDRGTAGADGRDGIDGRDGEVDTEEMRRLAEAPVQQHEQTYDHKLLHDPYILGTLKVDESTLGEDRYLKFQNGKLVYADIPKPAQYGGLYSSSRGSGTSSLVIHTKTSAYTIESVDDVILCDASSGPFTITLPVAGSTRKKRFVIKKIDSTDNLITIQPNGTETIDGSTSQGLIVQWAQFTLIPIESSNSWIISA